MGALMLASGCGDDTVESVPVCDEIGWPLGLSPSRTPPPPDFSVVCAEGWGHELETREATQTIALPASGWSMQMHPDGGVVISVLAIDLDRWGPWFERNDLEAQPGLVWIDADGESPLCFAPIFVWSFDFVGEQIWALGTDEGGDAAMLVLDWQTGAVLDSRPWTNEGNYNRLFAARDPAGGAWVTALENLPDGQSQQFLYRVTSLDDMGVVEIARRTTEDPGTRPAGALEPLLDGGAAWSMRSGFDVLAADGVRWVHEEGWPGASDEDSLLITSRVATGVGAGQRLRIEKRTLNDGTLIWAREHQRFEVADPAACGPDACALVDVGSARRRPDGGYMLVARHAYPSNSCGGQPMVMAIGEDGEAKWAHRVDVCGWTGGAGASGGGFALIGMSSRADEMSTQGAWVRTLPW